MKDILGFIRSYSREVNKPILIVCTIFIAILIWLNYGYGLEYRMTHSSILPWPQATGHYLIYFVAFFVPHLLLLIKRKDYSNISIAFIVCFLVSPLIFAWKVSMDTTIHLSASSDWNKYWNEVIYWPPRLMIVTAMIAVIYFFLNKEEAFYGVKPKKINWKPYCLMLLIMIPLIAAASTQHDFLAVYPKIKEILPLPANTDHGWFYKLLYELSYGSDFITIEFFFRGFLVIGFIKWVGKDAILPMACFYCTIHFGKPMGECISSYFGGLLLGIVSYHTRSIYGGLMVHLGIAWLMEAGGYIGNLH